MDLGLVVQQYMSCAPLQLALTFALMNCECAHNVYRFVCSSGVVSVE